MCHYASFIIILIPSTLDNRTGLTKSKLQLLLNTLSDEWQPNPSFMGLGNTSVVSSSALAGGGMLSPNNSAPGNAHHMLHTMGNVNDGFRSSLKI